LSLFYADAYDDYYIRVNISKSIRIDCRRFVFQHEKFHSAFTAQIFI